MFSEGVLLPSEGLAKLGFGDMNLLEDMEYKEVGLEGGSSAPELERFRSTTVLMRCRVSMDGASSSSLWNDQHK